MKPGRELDAAVCEALGIAPHSDTPFDFSTRKIYPPVSTDRTAMWLVIDQLRGLGFFPTFHVCPGGHDEPDHKPCWVVTLDDPDGVRFYEGCGGDLPLAVCRAALDAFEKIDAATKPLHGVGDAT